MTPYQAARQFCANAEGTGCAGLGISDSGQTVRLWPRRTACTVASQRCLDFETCVAPQVRTMEQGPPRDSWLQAVNLYLNRLEPKERVQAKVNIFGNAPDERLDNLTPSRKCPQCGKPMEARHRYCEACTSAKRRETYRLANAKRLVPQYNS